jgi:mannose-6-phosphate isomerase-like protein (cupin superfamily)
MNACIRKVEEGEEYFFKEGCHILEWLNTPDDPAVSVAQARVEPGVRTRRHRLSGITERYLVLEGTGRVEVGGLPVEEVGPGSVVTIPPETDQRIENTGDGPLVFLAVCTPRFRPEAYAVV